jgi:Spy/CpxP family protein refolding chaperone
MKLVLAFAAAVAMAAMTFSAQAAPIAAAQQGYQSNHVTYVAGGCGPHRHRDRWGHCVHW